MLITSVLLIAVVASVSAQTTRPESEQQLAHDIYKQFIEIQSGFTSGATTPVAEAAAARLRAAGFPDSDIFVGGASAKKANLVVRYHGTGARKPLLLLAHIDVVEAKREDWSIDPFQLTEKDGYFYGRGTGDDKAQAAVWIANLIEYKKGGFKPDRDIIVALTADEEGGGPYNGVDWLLKNHRELIEADFALNEGGWGESLGGRKLSNDLQISEKYVINLRFEVRNKGGHSSLPVADNAIYHLAFALAHLSEFAFPLKTNDVTAAYFKQMSKIESGPVSADLAGAARRFHRSHAKTCCCFSGVERYPAYHLCCDRTRRRPRNKCPTATRRCKRQLQGAPRRFTGVCSGYSEKSGQRRGGQDYPRS